MNPGLNTEERGKHCPSLSPLECVFTDGKLLPEGQTCNLAPIYRQRAILPGHQGSHQTPPPPPHSCLPQIASISPEGVCVHLCSIFRNCYPRDKFPECLTLLSQWTFHSCIPQHCSKQKAALKQLSPQGPAQTEQAKTPSSQSSPKIGLFAYFKSCCLVARLLMSTYLEADWAFLVAQPSLPTREASEYLPRHLSLACSKLPASPWEFIYTFSDPDLGTDVWGNEPLGHKFLVARGL